MIETSFILKTSSNKVGRCQNITHFPASFRPPNKKDDRLFLDFIRELVPARPTNDSKVSHDLTKDQELANFDIVKIFLGPLKKKNSLKSGFCIKIGIVASVRSVASPIFQIFTPKRPL